MNVKVLALFAMSIGLLLGCSRMLSKTEIGAGTPALYECHICQLHFKEQKWADKCIEWCKANESCNLEIARHSEEAIK